MKHSGSEVRSQQPLTRLTTLPPANYHLFCRLPSGCAERSPLWRCSNSVHSAVACQPRQPCLPTRCPHTIDTLLAVMLPRVTLFTRPGCTLCDSVKFIIRKVSQKVHSQTHTPARTHASTKAHPHTLPCSPSHHALSLLPSTSPHLSSRPCSSPLCLLSTRWSTWRWTYPRPGKGAGWPPTRTTSRWCTCRTARWRVTG